MTCASIDEKESERKIRAKTTAGITKSLKLHLDNIYMHINMSTSGLTEKMSSKYAAKERRILCSFTVSCRQLNRHICNIEKRGKRNVKAKEKGTDPNQAGKRNLNTIPLQVKEN